MIPLGNEATGSAARSECPQHGPGPWMGEGFQAIETYEILGKATLWSNITITMEISLLLMGQVTISMAIFNSYVKLPEGRHYHCIAIYAILLVYK